MIDAKKIFSFQSFGAIKNITGKRILGIREGYVSWLRSRQRAL
jgi:hypothetical protein